MGQGFSCLGFRVASSRIWGKPYRRKSVQALGVLGQLGHLGYLGNWGLALGFRCSTQEVAC